MASLAFKALGSVGKVGGMLKSAGGVAGLASKAQGALGQAQAVADQAKAIGNQARGVAGTFKSAIKGPGLPSPTPPAMGLPKPATNASCPCAHV